MMGRRPSTTHTIVIGGGLSGLQAAHDLQRAGIDCLVLEARDRIGGKLLSVQSGAGSAAIELGGAWINDVNQPRAISLARKLNLELIKQNTTGDCILEDYGRFSYGSEPPLSDDDVSIFVRIRNKIEALTQSISLMKPSTSFPMYRHMHVDELAQSMGANDVIRRLVNIWTVAMLGTESNAVSAIFFLHYCRAGGGFLQMRSDEKGGGQHLRFRGGAQELCHGLRNALKPNTVLLSAAVSSISHTLNGPCTITTSDGSLFSCKRVISTVPSVLLTRIAISPSLSADKLWLSTWSRMGFYAKVFLIYPAPWWRSLGLCGLAQGINGPVSLTRDVSSDDDELFSLVCFVVGEKGQAWARKPQNDRSTEVLTNVDRIYGMSCPRPITVQEMIWNEERFSEGAPCPVVPISGLQLLDRDHWRPEGCIYFAGTETSSIWKGYMEGALESGSRAASEIIEDCLWHGRYSKGML